MITTVVFTPQPLFLLPEYRGRTDPAPELRAAAVGAVASLAVPDRVDRVVVVTGAPTTRPPASGPRAGGGGGSARAGAGAGSRLPAGLRVGYELLAEAGVGFLPDDLVVPADLPTDACLELGRELAVRHPDDRVGLLVTADGSARRGEKAPGHVDDRAFGYDEAFVRAIERGAPDELAALDAGLAAELLFQGRAALQVAAGAVGPVPASPITTFTGDPFGVMYVVAVWQLG